MPVTNRSEYRHSAMRRYTAKAKEYGIPDFMLKDRNIPTDADLDAYFKDVKQEMTNAGFQGVEVPQTAEQRTEKKTMPLLP